MVFANAWAPVVRHDQHDDGRECRRAARPAGRDDVVFRGLANEFESGPYD
jgi:hypothetical protein